MNGYKMKTFKFKNQRDVQFIGALICSIKVFDLKIELYFTKGGSYILKKNRYILNFIVISESVRTFKNLIEMRAALGYESCYKKLYESIGYDTTLYFK